MIVFNQTLTYTNDASVRLVWFTKNERSNEHFFQFYFKKIKVNSNVLFKVFMCLVALNSAGSSLILFSESDVKKAILEYCKNRPPMNFCSANHIKIMLQMLRLRENAIEMQRKEMLIKNNLSKLKFSKFLNDFHSNRFF